MRTRLLCLLALIMTGCATRQPPDLAPASALPAVLLLPNYPLDQVARPTTSAEVFLGNLNARIRPLPTDSSSVERSAMAGHLYQRYQILGAQADLDLAFELARTAANAPAADNESKLLWATLAAYMHEFDAALAALDSLPADSPAVLSLRAQVALARGTPSDAAAHDGPRTLTENREFNELVSAAGRCVDAGSLECASSNYHQAQFLYHDVAPLPLAWLHTQQGIALLRFGHPDRAIPFFRAALDRLPGYYLAAEHLGECLGLIGQLDEARSVYQAVITQTDNPEYMAGLAAIEDMAGNAEVAATWREQARVGYARRLAKFPVAYAQHAVGFYLEIGELDQARLLAEQNITLRQDVGSWLLLAQVAQTQGDSARACSAWAAALATGLSPPEMIELDSLQGACRGERRAGVDQR